jgi:hypothetical protein
MRRRSKAGSTKPQRRKAHQQSRRSIRGLSFNRILQQNLPSGLRAPFPTAVIVFRSTTG